MPSIPYDILQNSIDNGGSPHTTVFVSEVTNVARGSKAGAWKTVGYVNPDGFPCPIEYVVAVTSIRNRCSIIATIQEQIDVKVGSRWEPFLPSNILNMGNVIAQGFSGGKMSMVSKASSRRIWQGSTPVTMSFNMKFEAVRDSFTEVVEPCRMLQSLALPSDPSNGAGTNFGGLIRDTGAALGSLSPSKVVDAVAKNGPLLIPPGPTPFTLEGVIKLPGNIFEFYR